MIVLYDHVIAFETKYHKYLNNKNTIPISEY